MESNVLLIRSGRVDKQFVDFSYIKTDQEEIGMLI